MMSYAFLQHERELRMWRPKSVFLWSNISELTICRIYVKSVFVVIYKKLPSKREF